MRDGYWVIRTYRAGAVGEKTKYFVPGKRPDRIRRKDKRLASKAEKSSGSVIRQAARLLNANCTSGEEYVMIGLDYSQEGMNKILEWGRKNGMPVDSADEEESMNARWEAADHELVNTIRRVKRAAGKLGIELKSPMYITSDMDGETGETVRVHHHLVVNAETLPAFQSCWEEAGMGHVDYRKLWGNQKDRTPIAEYMINQVRRIPDAKKYRSTRNVIRPVAHDQIARTNAELRPPKGSELLFRQEFRKGGDQYIRYTVPEERKQKYDAERTQEADGSNLSQH